MTDLTKLIDNDIRVEVDIYLSNVSTADFINDVRALMQEYSDNGVIDKAIELLSSCRTKEVK